MYDSDRNNITNPRHLKSKAEKLAYLQRKMSKKKKGSNNRNKCRIRLTRQYEKLVNTRDDFWHKTSRYYVNKYDAVAVEDMPITNMVHGNLGKHILDASWGKFRQFVSYKAENAGKLYVPVNYRGTTQRCSQCQTEVRKELKDRIHNCPVCGFEVPRDYNSALEVKRLGWIEIQKLHSHRIGQELPESTPVEMLAIPHQRQPASLKQEAPSSKSVRI